MIVEMMALITLMPRDDIKNAWSLAFKPPPVALKPPPVSARTIQEVARILKSQEVQRKLVLMRFKPDQDWLQTEWQYEPVHTYEDGTQARIGIPRARPPTTEQCKHPEFDADALWKGLNHITKAKQRVDAFLKGMDKLNPSEGAVDTIDKLLRAAEKLGVPREEAELLAKAGKIQDVLRTSLTRQVIKAALINGAWQSAALTAVFDIKRLFDGHVQHYLLNMGICGLQGGAGRPLGLSVSYIPGLGDLTDREVKTMYDGIKSQLAPAGVEPDPTLSPREVVEAIVAQGSSGERASFNVRMTDATASDVIDFRKALLDLWEAHPEAFEAFLENLRAASRKS
ncbi:hypothetical protein S40293_01102 [Stachybotrys chartarum IBT 40293]|nr:hypothetical protein S40293_01102 [Stachybotrys chartarum IBT 40293]